MMIFSWIKEIKILGLACFFLAVFFPVSAQEQNGDSQEGARVFRRCVACHYADQERNKVGPSLKNLIGSQAGTKEGYRYSPAMVKAGEAGLIWKRDTLIEYLRSPQAMVRGTRMAPVRLTSEQEIDDLIAYIMMVSQETTPSN